ncbi:hypothetical protein D1007_27175 [Hordeum vulgare]|nr:hypothetical protein D1007_27175 [Hordeum vulgare]
MAEGRRGSAGAAAEGLDADLPKVPIALDFDLNVDLTLLFGPVEVRTVAPNLAIVVYEGPVTAVAADGAPAPPAVAESAAVEDVEMGAIVVYEGPAGGGDGAVTEVRVLPTLDDDAMQIVPAGSADADSTVLPLSPLCHPPLQQVPPPGVVIPLLPWAGSSGGRRRQSRRRRSLAPNTPVTARAWVRDQLEKKHHLPRSLQLSYIGQKVVSSSDVNPRHTRFLLPASARRRLRAFLNPAEIAACGFDVIEPKATKTPGVRAKPTTYPGVPLSVYLSSGRASALDSLRSDQLKLNKFHKSDSTVINGKGYRHFMVDCGMQAGDGVELWAFRWPPGIRPCLLIANRDGSRLAPNP